MLSATLATAGIASAIDATSRAVFVTTGSSVDAMTVPVGTTLLAHSVIPSIVDDTHEVTVSDTASIRGDGVDCAIVV